MTTTTTIQSADDFLGHPKGLYICFFTEMWERFSFYGMKALLLLYLTKYHLFSDSSGFDLIGAYGGLVYCIPVIGGLLADRYLGMRKAVIFGGLLLCLGHLGMAFEGDAATVANGVTIRDEASLSIFYISLALIIMGVGFLKPNISTIVGKLYATHDARRDSGFSLFYAGINLGALFASIVCGYLGETLGWSYGFGAAGIGVILGLTLFIWGQRYLHGHAEPLNPLLLREKRWGLTREHWIYLGSIVGLIPIALLMWAAANAKFSLGGHLSLAMMLMIVLMLIVLIWFVWFITTQCSKVQREQMLSLMALIFLCLIFFTLYEQTYGSWVTFTDRMLTKDLFPSLVRAKEAVIWTGSLTHNIGVFFTHAPWSMYSLLIAPLSFVVADKLSNRGGNTFASKALFGASGLLILLFLIRDLALLPQTAGSLTFLGAMFIVLLAPVFTGLWGWLDRYQLNPSKPIKSAIGLAFAGLAFLPLVFAAEQAGLSPTGQASVWWLVLAYFILEIGEMCLSPVGLSAVTQLSVPRVVSLMMGTWFLATAFSESLAAILGKQSALDIPVGESINIVEAASKYSGLFTMLFWIGIGCAFLAFIAAPWIRRGMHGVK
jgi:POT family proton-dependent oligopeptide transporter